MENELEEIYAYIKGIVEVMEILQKQISGHTEILKLMTNYEEE